MKVDLVIELGRVFLGGASWTISAKGLPAEQARELISSAEQMESAYRESKRRPADEPDGER